MYYFSINYRCKAVLWLAITVFTLNCGVVLTQPPHARAHYVRGNNNRDHSSERQDQHFPFENNPGQESSERYVRQHFPFGNNPGQQILDRIKTNLGVNSNLQFGNQGNFNLGMPFGNNFGNIAQQNAQNTYNILNKTFENLNQFSMGNFGNFNNFNQYRPSPPPNFSGGDKAVPEVPASTPIVPTVPVTSTHSTVTSALNMREQNNYKTTTSKSTGDNISHYIEGFPVIPLKSNEIRK